MPKAVKNLLIMNVSLVTLLYLALYLTFTHAPISTIFDCSRTQGAHDFSCVLKESYGFGIYRQNTSYITAIKEVTLYSYKTYRRGDISTYTMYDTLVQDAAGKQFVVSAGDTQEAAQMKQNEINSFRDSPSLTELHMVDDMQVPIAWGIMILLPLVCTIIMTAKPFLRWLKEEPLA